MFQFSAIQTAARENARPTVVETSFEIFHGDPVTTRSIPPDHSASFSVAVALLALGDQPRKPPSQVMNRIGIT